MVRLLLSLIGVSVALCVPSAGYCLNEGGCSLELLVISSEAVGLYEISEEVKKPHDDPEYASNPVYDYFEASSFRIEALKSTPPESLQVARKYKRPPYHPSPGHLRVMVSGVVQAIWGS